ncbi:hypothetical protein Nepgr_024637 [Nepenthes gracilis]|uniref:N-acetyltransferase domain-containing protein n=1 Tax=Nepenthes gracilis TaxID=150966 RepID=A0AAD3T4W4_NEPGR|nr:hypothetical protein Nepgr_024637 [Nepenthes gracilis]
MRRSFQEGKRRIEGSSSSYDSESDDHSYAGRRNMPRSSKNSFLNYRVDLLLDGEDFAMDDDSSSTTLKSSRRGPRQSKNRPRSRIAGFGEAEVGISSRRKGEEGGGRGKRGRARHRRRMTGELAENSIVVEEKEQEENGEERKSEKRGTILSWLIDMKVVREKEKVRCMDNTRERVLGGGSISRGGIVCDCCKEMFTVSRFQIHAGADDVHRPYEKIFVSETNVPLSACQIEAWNRQTTSVRGWYHHIEPPPDMEDEHDDACIICADGGNLICCENCPSTYHLDCLRMEIIGSAMKTKTRCPSISIILLLLSVEIAAGRSNFNRVNFSGFYTAILEHKDEVISVASIRIHGRNIAEMPFIATSESWRRRGMCKALLNGIESALCDLRVECLIIPSTPGRVAKWKKNFGFSLIEEEMVEELTKLNALMFPFATRLQKTIQGQVMRFANDLNLDPPEED